MGCPKGLHYRRQHTPVPVVEEDAYRVQIGIEGKELRKFSLAELKRDYAESDLVVTFMCTGNRRSEYNTPEDGETMEIPSWRSSGGGHEPPQKSRSIKAPGNRPLGLPSC